MSESINELIEALRREAGRAEFPVDTPIYERSGRDPTEPIFFAGSLDAPLCILGRDLGKDEVRARPAADWGGWPVGPRGDHSSLA